MLLMKQATTLAKRLSKVAQRLRVRAARQRIEDEAAERRARQADTAAHIVQWASSPGLQTPK